MSEVVSGDRGRPSLPCSKEAALVAVEGTDHHLEKKDQDRNEESSFAFLSAVAQGGNGMSWVGEVGSDEASGDQDLPLPSSAEGAERNRTAAVLSSLPVAAAFEVVPSLTLLATLGMLV